MRTATPADLAARIERGFRDAPFVADLGIALSGLGPGWCEATLALGTGRTNLMQGAVHLAMFAGFLFLALVP